jgi:hypothetical protein
VRSDSGSGSRSRSRLGFEFGFRCKLAFSFAFSRYVLVRVRPIRSGSVISSQLIKGTRSKPKKEGFNVDYRQFMDNKINVSQIEELEISETKLTLNGKHRTRT